MTPYDLARLRAIHATEREAFLRRHARLVRARWWSLQHSRAALWSVYVAMWLAAAVYLRLHHQGIVP